MNLFSMLVIYSINGVIFGLITQYIARSKGYEKGFAWGFWLGVIGLLVVGFKPSIDTDPEKKNQQAANGSFRITSNINQPKKESGWLCNCGTRNKTENRFCKNCGRKSTTVVNWTCTACGKRNEENAAFCVNCGMNKKDVH